MYISRWHPFSVAMMLWPDFIVFITTLNDICHKEIGLLLTSLEGSRVVIRATELPFTELVNRGDL